jgi:hypothetical protein
MKRFLLFAFDGCYPEGGWADMVCGYDDLAEALKRTKTLRSDYWQIVDAECGEVLHTNQYGY